MTGRREALTFAKANLFTVACCLGSTLLDHERHRFGANATLLPEHWHIDILRAYKELVKARAMPVEAAVPRADDRSKAVSDDRP